MKNPVDIKNFSTKAGREGIFSLAPGGNTYAVQNAVLGSFIFFREQMRSKNWLPIWRSS